MGDREKRLILEMVAEGRISAEEGEQLLRDLTGTPTSQEEVLVELDAFNLLRLGIEAVAQQVVEVAAEPSWRQRMTRLQAQLGGADYRENTNVKVDKGDSVYARTEQMKASLAALIEYAEELNASLDAALAGRKKK